MQVLAVDPENGAQVQAIAVKHGEENKRQGAPTTSTTAAAAGASGARPVSGAAVPPRAASSEGSRAAIPPHDIPGWIPAGRSQRTLWAQLSTVQHRAIPLRKPAARP